jgi:hypothetical protein
MKNKSASSIVSKKNKKIKKIKKGVSSFLFSVDRL